MKSQQAAIDHFKKVPMESKFAGHSICCVGDFIIAESSGHFFLVFIFYYQVSQIHPNEKNNSPKTKIFGGVILNNTLKRIMTLIHFN